MGGLRGANGLGWGDSFHVSKNLGPEGEAGMERLTNRTTKKTGKELFVLRQFINK